jgi:hypothetical protein
MATDIRRTAAALGVEVTLARILAQDLLTSWGELESALLGVPDNLLTEKIKNDLAALAEADREAANKLTPNN